MHPIFLEAPQQTSKWEIGLNHATIILGIILTILGILVAYFKLRAQHKETLASREVAAVERAEQKELLEMIAKEFKPNHGSSLVDRVAHIGESLSNHCSDAQSSFAANAKTLEELKATTAEQSRRIDGLYDIVVGGNSTLPRKTAARHSNREEDS